MAKLYRAVSVIRAVCAILLVIIELRSVAGQDTADSGEILFVFCCCCCSVYVVGEVEFLCLF